jgi:hypothetical protein
MSEIRTKDFSSKELMKLNKSQLCAVAQVLDTTIKKIKTDATRITSELKKAVSQEDCKTAAQDVITLCEALGHYLLQPPVPTTTDVDKVKSDTAPGSTTEEESGGTVATTNDKQRIMKLDPNTPSFGKDKRENIDEWLFAMESSFMVANIPDQFKLAVAVPYLKGVPLQTLIRYMTDNETSATWKEFTDILINNHKPDDLRRRLRVQLRDLRQHESLDNYISQFRSIVNRLDGLSEEDQVFYFTEGLSQKSRYEVNSKGCDTLEKAISVASQFEACFGKQNAVEVNYTKTINKRGFRPKRHFYNNNNMNNNNNNNFNKNNGVERKIKPKEAHQKPTCFICKKVGHKANECRSKGDKPFIKPKVIAVCRSNMESILHTDGLIENQEVKLSLDIGAVESVISKGTVERLGLTVYPSEVQVKTATNEISNVLGETQKLCVNVEGHTCNISFLVLEMDDHDVLLGLNWFEATGAGVYPMEKILRFPGHTVHLSKNTEKFDFYDEPMDILLTEVIDEDDIDDESSWEKSSGPLMVSKEPLDEKQQKLFNNLCNDVGGMFATDFNDLGECKVREHVINLKDPTPIFTYPYRKSLKERKEIQLEIEKMLKAKIIRKSKSAWSSPIIMIPKKDGTKRMCVDYRKLNSNTTLANWPLPRILDILDRLNGSSWFSAMDLKSGYWQIKMHPASVEYTAFSTPDGHYEFLRLPFGLKNAPSDFSRIMHQVLGGLDFVEIYLDDITVHSKSFEEHIKHLKTVFELLKSANLKINKDKCTWCAKSIKLLGHVVSANEIAMDQDKLSAIRDRLPPKNIKQLQQYLGICNYYRRFIKGFSNISAPLFRLLSKDVIWEWGDKQSKAFEELKQALISSPTLRQPNFEKEFLLFTDASGYAIGAVLSQKDDSGAEYVCSYSSRLLKNAEIHYGISEKECLAVVWAIKQFRIYLHGTKFKVITDHSALAWLMSIKDPTARPSSLVNLSSGI